MCGVDLCANVAGLRLICRALSGIGFGLTVAIAGIMFVLRKRILKQKDGEMVISVRARAYASLWWTI